MKSEKTFKRNELIQTLWDLYFNALVSLLYSWVRKTGCLTMLDVEDAISRTFEKLMNRNLSYLEDLVNKEKPLTVLYTIAKNILIDEIRRNKKLSSILTDKITQNIETFPVALSNLRKEEIIAKLSEYLPNGMADVLFLEAMGFTRPEMAEILDKNINSVNVAISRSRKRALKILSE